MITLIAPSLLGAAAGGTGPTWPRPVCVPVFQVLRSTTLACRPASTIPCIARSTTAPMLLATGARSGSHPSRRDARTKLICGSRTRFTIITSRLRHQATNNHSRNAQRPNGVHRRRPLALASTPGCLAGTKRACSVWSSTAQHASHCLCSYMWYAMPPFGLSTLANPTMCSSVSRLLTGHR